MQRRCGSSIPAERANTCTTNVSERRGGDNSRSVWGRVCSECGGRMEIGWDGARSRGGVGACSGIVQSGRAFETRSPFLVLCRVEGGLFLVGWRRGAGRRVLKSVEEWRYFIGMAVVLTEIPGVMGIDCEFCGGAWARGTATAFCPRRTRRNAENGNCFLVREVTRRGAENGHCFLSTEGAEDALRLFHWYFAISLIIISLQIRCRFGRARKGCRNEIHI